MPNSDKIISDLVKAIEDSIDDFDSGIPAIQKQIYKRILELSRDFHIPAKTVQQQAENLKLIGKIKGEIDSIVLNDSYTDKVTDFVNSFDEVTKIQSSYFAAISTEFKPFNLLKEIKKTSIDLTIEKLTENGISVNVSEKTRDILYRNITTGGSYADLVEDMRAFLIGTEKKPGALSRYTKQITTDALNIYSAQYNKAVTDDLGLEWFKYVGSLIKTSRPFCTALIHAKGEGMEYIHISQFKEITEGLINGKIVSLSGLIEGTDATNFFINRGGYGCGHQLMPVSEAVVPQVLRDKFRGWKRAA